MRVTVLLMGKTEEEYLRTGIAVYDKRLQHYLPVETLVIPELKNTKNLSNEQQKEKEGKLILSRLRPDDEMILLDERGKEFTSKQFAGFLEKKSISGTRNLVFVVGGAYGFSD